MAEATEEVLVDIEAEDNASPRITTVGRSLAVMGSTLTMITKDLGIHSAALDQALKAYQVFYDAVRFVGAAQTLLHWVNQLVAASTVEMSAADAAAIAWASGYTTAAVTETTANYGLAASFEAVNTAMGPVGWAILGIGLAGAAVGGYALAGGFAGSPASPTTDHTTINIANVDMQTQANVEATARNLGTLIQHNRRRFGR